MLSSHSETHPDGRATDARPLRVDVLLPTHNRSALVGRTLETLIAARRPAGLQARVIVVDNNSRDDTRAVVERAIAKGADAGLPIVYLFEPRPGKSHALNTGVAATDCDVVGMIDDDEDVEPRWFEAIAEAFADPRVDYITGPCLPRWEVEPPRWLAAEFDGVLGLFHAGDRVLSMPDEYRGQMMGGNAAVRRSVLLSAGGYDASLGPSEGARQLSCEDSEMHERLRRMGARGQYRPDFIILHFVPRTRLVKRYFRHWFFWHGVSRGVLDLKVPQSVPYTLGIPRYLWGEAVRDVLGLVGLRRLPGSGSHESRRLGAVLRLIHTAGHWYGRSRFQARRQPVAIAGVPSTSPS
jgi:glycosyltransferase involved in cell wall biosynthesis